jgi:AraC-like DNA-binding protein
LDHLLRASLYVAEDAGPEGRGRSGSRLAELVMEMVGRSPALPFTVEKIAAAAQLTPNHFTTVFRRQAGVGFSRFLTQKRIALAQSLLRDLSLNIAQVAKRSGFDDPSYFARRFRQITGMSPAEWRGGL